MVADSLRYSLVKVIGSGRLREGPFFPNSYQSERDLADTGLDVWGIHIIDV